MELKRDVYKRQPQHSLTRLVDGKIEGGVYVHGAGIDIQDAIVLKGCEHLLLRK